jgi:hypothetical protein
MSITSKYRFVSTLPRSVWAILPWFLVTMTAWNLYISFWLLDNTNGFPRNQKLAIVIPFGPDHYSDVERLVTVNWKRFSLGRADNVYLYFYFSGDLAAKPKLLAKLKSLPVPKSFKKVYYLSANLQGDYEKYPIGPSNMFFELFNQPLMAGMNAFMWYEPDVSPCRQNWLPRLYLQAFTGSSFWIKGSLQRGAPDKDGFYAQADHINGNAIYNLSSSRFLSFLQIVAKQFEEIPEDYLSSFDVAIWIVMKNHIPYKEYAEIRRLYFYTDFIQNYYVRPVNATELCISNDETYLVHGRNVFF